METGDRAAPERETRERIALGRPRVRATEPMTGEGWEQAASERLVARAKEIVSGEGWEVQNRATASGANPFTHAS